MPRKVADSILRGAEEALEFAKGRAKGHRVLIPDEIDVRRIRTELKLSQAAFATYFGVSRRTIQEWEQGRRVPTGPARVLLTVISREPEAVLRALAA
ncbi:MAG: helix-turn-helix domain-containing protein [Proteobacteria bacterium]|nr:helix-turn-helix domain-containing protein [Pseudomonadota bacterium]